MWSRPPRVPGVPSATIVPFAITAARVARYWASSMKWVVRKIVFPIPVRFFTISQALRLALGSNPVVGSSRNRSSGSPARAIATSSRRCWPPDSLFTRVFRFSANPTRSMTSSTLLGDG